MSHRIEKDSLGEVQVPAGAYWGSQAQRTKDLFQISGLTEHDRFIDAFVLVKKAAAQANTDLGLLDTAVGNAIVQAADEILSQSPYSYSGTPQRPNAPAPNLRSQFPVDVFHMGAGTSFNMNVNEVLANRAEEILGGQLGKYEKVNPNDHPNYGQSTNDTVPTSIRVMARLMLEELFASVDLLEGALRKKGQEFDGILKSGRTHLQDAVPIRLGQEFKGYADAVKKCRRWLEHAAFELEELGIGGSAAGTGLNTHPDYRFKLVENLNSYVPDACKFRAAPNLVAEMQSQLPVSALSAALRIFCLEMTRITNDLRLMCSGPLTGLAEIVLPPVQPGSSIMPGKINPSVAENYNIVLYQVLGQCHSLDMCVQAGQLELNVMMPGMAFSGWFSLQILTNATRVFAESAVAGIKANEERCRYYAEVSPSLATALNTYVGYKTASEVVKQALAEGKTIPDVVRERNLLDEETLKKALDPALLTEPGIPGKSSG
jgi:aspartate ammonia-lyase